ncbi:hypothetical protein [Salimicrobium flavidum]|uniref:hypothetical protein n=1 Tax=Salimicrobium flavidum TaxID=570947 RepID=UPI0009708D40|nr:hypothetical protein [Salimicrobium flavidum]
MKKEELKGNAKHQAEKVLEEELAVESSGAGTGHLYRDSGAGEVHKFKGNDEEYRMVVSSRGGHLLGVTMSSPEVYPVHGDLEEVALRMVRVSEVPGEGWRADSLELEDEIRVSIFQTEDSVGQRNNAVEAEFHKRGERFALMSIDFSFAYKDKSDQNVSAEVSPEEAKEALSSSVTVEGEAKLTQVESSSEKGVGLYF